MLFRVVLAVAVLAVFVYGLVDVIRTEGRQTRGISKPAWIVVMIVLPVVGAILWLLIGRPRYTPEPRQGSRTSTAPDDDPDFLRNLEYQRRKQAQAARAKALLDEQKRQPGTADPASSAKESTPDPSSGRTGGSGNASGTPGSGKDAPDGSKAGHANPLRGTEGSGDAGKDIPGGGPAGSGRSGDDNEGSGHQSSSDSEAKDEDRS